MSRYRAVLFDLCDTLVHFDADRLPLIEVGGQPTRSTAQAVHRALTAVPPIPFGTFHACLLAVTAEIAAARELDDREVTSRERFQRVLTRLGAEASPAAADRLVVAHMTRLADALVLPPHHREVVASLGLFRRGTVTADVRPGTGRTVYGKSGELFSISCSIIATLTIIFPLRGTHGIRMAGRKDRGA